MSDPFPIPLAIVLDRGPALATPDSATSGVLVLRNDGSNKPQWGQSPAAATFTVLTNDPLAPDDDTYWVVRQGTSPNQTLALRARVNGVTHQIAGITI